MPPLLQVEDLSVSFATDGGELRAVEQVSFSVEPGEVVGLVGESGCGKTVTAMSLLRLVPMPPGRIAGRALFAGRDLLTMPLPELRDLRGRRISFIFQEPMTALSPLQRVGSQLAETVRLHRPEVGRREAWRLAAEWLRKVGISDPEDRCYNYPYQLSGGMRQRVMIAMALMLHPDLIIADEPTTALDVTIQAQIFELILAMREKDTSLLLITHDMGVVWEVCDRVIVMYAARIVEEGRRDDLFGQPLHPYTRGLLSAMPRLSREPGGRLPTRPGQVPSPLHYPPGCHFADRCPFAAPRCRRESPPLRELGPGRRVACWKAEAEAAARPWPPAEESAGGHG